MGYVLFVIVLLATVAMFACTVFSGDCAREEENRDGN